MLRVCALGAYRGQALRALAAAMILLVAFTSEAGAATLSVDPQLASSGSVGTTWNVNVTVERASGEAQVVPMVTIVNRATGERRDFLTSATNQPDVYEATVVFSSPGKWTYEVVYGDARVPSGQTISIAGDSQGSGWQLLALVASAIAVIALAALVILVVRRPRRARAPSPPAPSRSEPPPPDLVRDRQTLIGSYLYLYDIVRDDVLRERLRSALEEAGVSELNSVGARFDPVQHRASGWVPTDDASLDGRIAEVERSGFSDRGAVLRLPDVLVYSASGGPRHR